jgi:uncharacterized membrane protein YkvA (DUF1232 family)
MYELGAADRSRLPVCPRGHQPEFWRVEHISAEEEISMRRVLLLWRVSRQDLRTLWFALRHRSRPIWLLPATGLMALFALDPANFAIPLLGAVDDLVLLPILLHALVGFLPAHVISGSNESPVKT